MTETQSNTNPIDRIGVEVRVRRLAASVLEQQADLEETLRGSVLGGAVYARLEALAERVGDLRAMCELLSPTHPLRWSSESVIDAHARWSLSAPDSDDQRARHVDLVIALAMLERALREDLRIAA